MNSTKVEELQLLQQNMQHLLAQKQQIESQLTELNSAITELKTTNQAYKIVGKIMIATSKEDLLKDLEKKKEMAEVRFSSFVKQEEKNQEKLEKVQKEAMEELSKK